VVEVALNVQKMGQFNAMLTRLKAELGDRAPQAVAQLARHICGEPTKYALHETTESLMKHGYSISELLAALLQCESARMNMLFAVHSSMPLHTQFSDLRRVIHNFNDIQDAVMEAAEQYLMEVHARNIRGAARLPGRTEDRVCEYDALDEAALTNIRQDTIARAMACWLDCRKVRLFNQFRGLPVNATARLLGKGNDKICVLLDYDVAKVFACHPDQDSAYVASPVDDNQIAVSVLDVSGKKLTLALGGVSPLYVDKRQNIGVQVAENIPVVLSSRGRNRVQAQLFDLSISGFGFIINQVVDPALFSSGAELRCECILNGRNIHIDGWVRWLQNYNGIMRLGMELETDRKLQQFLQQEIFRIQRAIIVAMNEVRLPDDMQQALAHTG